MSPLCFRDTLADVEDQETQGLLLNCLPWHKAPEYVRCNHRGSRTKPRALDYPAPSEGSFLFQKASTSHFPPVPLTPQGHPPLVKILAQLFGKLLGRDLDPMTNVMVTVGAYQALFCCFQAFIDEGDEVTLGTGLVI